MTIKSYRNFQKTEEKFIYIIWKYDQFLMSFPLQLHIFLISWNDDVSSF